jgi:RNA polymerase sigma factor (sigma-70 family)
MAEAAERLTDADAIEASLRDAHSFTLVFDRHAPAVHRYVSSRAPTSDVDDLVSETFVTAFRCRGRYDLRYDDARPWLLGIATNVLRHHRRAERRRLTRLRGARRTPPDPDPSEQVVSDLDTAAESRRVARAVERLDDKYRDVLLLVAGSGLSYDEVARALDIPIGTVRSRLARGRRQLRELLAPEGQHESGDSRTILPATEGSPG